MQYLKQRILTTKNIYTSIICNNNDNFSKIENLFYESYPEYKEINYNFFINGKKIKKNESLSDNGIGNNSIIIIKYFKILLQYIHFFS